MIPVFQKIMDKGRGDCLAACLASILELPLEAVPNFRSLAFDDNNACNFKYACPWLSERGLELVRVPWNGALEPYWRDVWCICKVPSQAFPDGSHYIVGHITGFSHLEIVHDPKSTNAPYVADQVTGLVLLVFTGSQNCLQRYQLSPRF